MVFWLVDLSHLPFVWRLIGRFMAFAGLIFRAQRFTNVEYDNGSGTTLHAYISYPPGYDDSQQYPTAIVYHAWNGMSKEPVYFADLLAEQGYLALAPDMFRGVASRGFNIPWNIMSVSSTPQDRINDDIDAALAYLDGLGTVEGDVFSGPGFCFGGSQALELTKRRTVAATVTLYGSYIDGLQDPNDDDAWGMLGETPILGIYGEEDGAPSPEEVNGFATAMVARGIEHTVTFYAGVGHAFVTPRNHRNESPQAVVAWNQVVDFMGDIVAENTQGRRTARISPSKNRVNVPSVYKPGHASFQMLWDHAMDPLLRKGHFDHHHRRKA